MTVIIVLIATILASQKEKAEFVFYENMKNHDIFKVYHEKAIFNIDFFSAKIEDCFLVEFKNNIHAEPIEIK